MNAHDMTFEDFEVGDVVSFNRRFTLGDFESFAALSGDHNPAHGSPEYAARSAQGQATVPLQLMAAPLSAIAGMGFGRHRSLCLTTKLKALQPVFYEQDITYSGRVIGKHQGSNALTLSVIAFQGHCVLLEAEMLVQIRDDMPPSPTLSDPLEIQPAGRARAALITGASGSIGRATARVMAKRGWDLAIQFKENRQAANMLRKELSEAIGTVEVIQASLNSEQETTHLVESLTRDLKPTAFLHLASPPIDAPAAAQFSVNYVACQQIMAGLLPDMLGKQEGSVLVLGSGGTHHARPGLENFVAAKNAAVGFATGIESRYGAYGIRGKIVALEYVDTEFSESFRPKDAAVLLAEEVAEAIVDHLEDKKPDCPPCLWLEPGTRRYGGIGFKECVEELAQPTLVAGDVSSQRQPATPSTTQGPAGVEELVRRFFDLPPLYPLAEGGLGVTPGWDSLAQIELIVSLESHLGIAFTSQEMAGATHMQALVSVVERKLGVNSGAPSAR